MRSLALLWLVAGLGSIHAEAVEIRTAELPWAVVNTAYRTLIETGVDGRCPDSDVAVSLNAGVLPPGFELRGGYLAGIPKHSGQYRFFLRAVNNCAAVVKEMELIVTGKPVLRVFPEELTCEYRFGESDPAPLHLQVSASWPELPYSIGIPVPWLGTRTRDGATPGTDSAFASDEVSLRIDPKTLTPGTYRTTIRLSTWMGANSPVVAVTLKVLPAE